MWGKNYLRSSPTSIPAMALVTRFVMPSQSRLCCKFKKHFLNNSFYICSFLLLTRCKSNHDDVADKKRYVIYMYMYDVKAWDPDLWLPRPPWTNIETNCNVLNKSFQLRYLNVHVNQMQTFAFSLQVWHRKLKVLALDYSNPYTKFEQNLPKRHSSEESEIVDTSQQ